MIFHHTALNLSLAELAVKYITWTIYNLPRGKSEHSDSHNPTDILWVLANLQLTSVRKPIQFPTLHPQPIAYRAKWQSFTARSWFYYIYTYPNPAPLYILPFPGPQFPVPPDYVMNTTFEQIITVQTKDNSCPRLNLLFVQPINCNPSLLNHIHGIDLLDFYLYLHWPHLLFK